MQVKKFEARTMKEALEMVKSQLGPDAIILSARDNNKSFGLVGQGSVEITAAVSEETLHKKRFVESRLREEDRNKLVRSPAKVQRQVIDQMVNKYMAEKEAQIPKPITRTRYVDIEEDHGPALPLDAGPGAVSSERIKSAAQRAWNSMQTGIEPSAPVGKVAKATSAPATKVAPESTEIQSLKNEIASLKQVITQFQKVPQSFMGQHPGADHGLHYDVSHMFEKLVGVGVAPDLAAEILTKAQETMTPVKLKNKALVDGWVAKAVLDATLISTEKQLAQLQVFVGPAGSGKTSSLIKMASHLVVREQKKVAIVTTDTHKVGAADQMRIYAQILNVPFAVLRQKEDWGRLMAQLSSYDVILVDFPGLSLKTMEEISSVRQLLPPEKYSSQIHLVLSCLAKDSDITEIGKRYRSTGFQDVIFTGLDESLQHGTIFNFMKRFSIPLHSFGTGSRVPEDFEVATKERVLDLLFKITKMKQQESKV